MTRKGYRGNGQTIAQIVEDRHHPKASTGTCPAPARHQSMPHSSASRLLPKRLTRAPPMNIRGRPNTAGHSRMT
jgi:hypothetical protein